MAYSPERSDRAVITGISGQDGSYPTELLLSKEYEVHGITQRSSGGELNRLAHLIADPDIFGKRLFLHHADLDDMTTIRRIFKQVKPSDVY